MKRIWRSLLTFFRMTDRWLLFFWILASACSLIMLAGITYSGLTYVSRIYTNAIAIGLGTLAALVMSAIDYELILKFWKIYLPLCLIGVALTFIIGIARGGDRAWLEIALGGIKFSVQPSEFLKISFIMTMSLHINHVKDEINRLPTLALLCLHGLLHVLLIQAQGDGGTALIFLFIFIFMVFFAGLSWKYIVTALASLLVIVPVLWFKVLTPDQQMRFIAVYDPSFSEKYAYQQLWGKVALASGGLQGTGVFNGQHTYVPEIYNDFIFTFVGNSTGFVGCLGVIVLLSCVCFKILYNSSIARNDLGKLICVGVFAMMASQTIINIGMCVGLLPVIGVTLPLLSAGGSSVLALYLGLGLVLSVYHHSHHTSMFSSNK